MTDIIRTLKSTLDFVNEMKINGIDTEGIERVSSQLEAIHFLAQDRAKETADANYNVAFVLNNEEHIKLRTVNVDAANDCEALGMAIGLKIDDIRGFAIQLFQVDKISE